jgi:hypothetical protein
METGPAMPSRRWVRKSGAAAETYAFPITHGTFPTFFTSRFSTFEAM